MKDPIAPGEEMDIGNGRVHRIDHERPFDSKIFGLDVLHQDQKWRDSDGIVWELDEMAPSHRKHLKAWLLRNAQHLAFQDSMISSCGPFAPRGDMASLDFEAAMDWQMDNPVEWMKTTPLFRRIKKLVKRDKRRAAKAEKVLKRTVWDG